MEAPTESVAYNKPKMARMFAPEFTNNWNMTVSEGSEAMLLKWGWDM